MPFRVASWFISLSARCASASFLFLDESRGSAILSSLSGRRWIKMCYAVYSCSLAEEKWIGKTGEWSIRLVGWGPADHTHTIPMMGAKKCITAAGASHSPFLLHTLCCFLEAIEKRKKNPSNYWWVYDLSVRVNIWWKVGGSNKNIFSSLDELGVFVDLQEFDVPSRSELPVRKRRRNYWPRATSPSAPGTNG